MLGRLRGPVERRVVLALQHHLAVALHLSQAHRPVHVVHHDVQRVEAVDNLKNEGYTVYSVEQAEGSIMLNELTLDKNRKYAIVMGNEVKGVQQEVIDHSHGCIEIPQYGTKHSLNVSVTAGIVIWDLFNKLK